MGAWDDDDWKARWREMRRRRPLRADRWAFRQILRDRFGVTNTKFDISFCVFRESFLQDQYHIRDFIDRVDRPGRIGMVDLGRNHGFVPYFLLDHIAARTTVEAMDYVGIDPAPLKFVHYPTAALAFPVRYRIIDRALVFDDAPTTRLKSGEANFGNFNVAGSNVEAFMAPRQNEFDYVELEVDTLIVKIVAKNRSSAVFEDVVARLSGRRAPALVACESDDTARGDVSHLASVRGKTLVWSNILSPGRLGAQALSP